LSIKPLKIARLFLAFPILVRVRKKLRLYNYGIDSEIPRKSRLYALKKKKSAITLKDF
jgi:hypothetical protein